MYTQATVSLAPAFPTFFFYFPSSLTRAVEHLWPTSAAQDTVRPVSCAFALGPALRLSLVLMRWLPLRRASLRPRARLALTPSAGWHLEISMDNNPLPLDLTIYGAIHQLARTSQEKGGVILFVAPSFVMSRSVHDQV
ncbi:hypothetical protein EI94DRAFT_1743172 [Lactarius quietus]|nr:hypothetical protein EI94DRAFT_1743172 [Lactarius quietus]